MRAERKCRGLLHKIEEQPRPVPYIQYRGESCRTPQEQRLRGYAGSCPHGLNRGAPGGARHVPFSVVPNSHEDTPSALSQAQQRAVAELLRVAPVADDLARRFQDAGFSLALVGGSVRDALLGRLGNDLDFTTDARPEDVLKIVRPWADALWEVGIAFGTVGAHKDGYQIEITTYRSEAYDRDRKSTRLNSSHRSLSRMPSSA